MLLSLLYHRVGNGKDANSLSFFEKHFSFIKENFETAHPGDTLLSQNTLCLTFDDAYFDFYYYIFPLLKRFLLKAVLSVPVGFIPEEVSISSKKRLEEILTLPKNHSSLPSPAYCTWDELREMHHSNLVHIASHSVNHQPLTAKNIDLEYELLYSKNLLEQQLNTSISTFVYPFGKLNANIHALAKKHYPYIMRIGNAVNFSWSNTNQLIYRINADAQPHPQAPFLLLKRFKYFFRYFLNTLRKK